MPDARTIRARRPPERSPLRRPGRLLLAVLVALAVAPSGASAAGQPVGAFGQNGVARVDLVSPLSSTGGPNPPDDGNAIAKGRADEIYVAGDTQSSLGRIVTLEKFDSDGPVPTFRSPNAAGHRFMGVVRRFTGENAFGLDVAYDTRETATRADDRIYVAGAVRPQGGGASDYLILRFLRSGQPDPAFGNGGVVRRSVSGTTEAQANAISIVGNRVYVAGSATLIEPGKPVAGHVFVAAHRTTNGSRFTDFAANGVWKLRPSFDVTDEGTGQPPASDALNVGDMEVSEDGRRIFVTGGANFSYVTNGQPFNANEAPFTLAVRRNTASTGAQGLSNWNDRQPRYNDTPGILRERGTGLANGEQGEVFASITRSQMFGNDPSLLDDILVVRFEETGDLNTAFGEQGIRTIRHKENSLGADGIAFEGASDKVTVAGIDWGAAGTNGDRRVLLVRLRSNGGFDPEFNWPPSDDPSEDGFVRRNVMTGQDDRATGIVIDGTRFAVSGRAGSRLLAAKFRR
jgi:hypothetical protein